MTRFIFVCLLAALSFAQAQREFEVASIKPASDPQQAQVAAGLHIDGSQVRITFFSLKDYIGMAYAIRPNQIVGPDWLGSQRFDIAAKIPEGAQQADVPDMLKILLSDRFQLKTHREMKEFPVYVLEVAKTGAKLTESAADANTDSADRGAVNVAAGGSSDGVMINLGKGAYFALGEKTLESKKIGMDRFADMLTRFLDRPVVDKTNLKGSYDLVLNLTPEDRMTMLLRVAVANGVVLPPQALALLDAGSTASLTDSLRKAGLTLEARRESLEVVVVDQMQKTPTEN